LSLGASKRCEDGSTRWSRGCGTDSPPDICAFGDYCHGLSYFVPFFCAFASVTGVWK
jgi:hypothetical protein